MFLDNNDLGLKAAAFAGLDAGLLVALSTTLAKVGIAVAIGLLRKVQQP